MPVFRDRATACVRMAVSTHHYLECRMLRPSTIVLFAILVVALCLQHASRRVVESELASLRMKQESLELVLARTRGELVGLSLTAEAKRKLLWDALLSGREQIADLRMTVEQREHYITSLEQGHMLMVTAYTNAVEETDDTPNITANNNHVREGIIAVSRDLFARGWVFGRQVYVNGIGVFTIDDLLAKRKRNQIDIFMFSKNEALRFGRRNIRVYLLGDG